MNKKDLKTFFYKQHTDFVSLTLIDNTIYLAHLVYKNSWSVKNIEQYIIDNDDIRNLSVNALKHIILKSGCKSLPIYICLQEDTFLAYQINFPKMTDDELEKAVYWDISGNSAIDSSKQNTSFCWKQSEDGCVVNIYAADRVKIMFWYDICVQLGLELAGIFPIQEGQAIIYPDNKLSLSLFKEEAFFDLSLNYDEPLPKYIAALTQTVLLRNSRLNLLPDKLKPAALNWKKLACVLSLMFIVPAVSLLLFFSICITDAKEEINAQAVQLRNTKNLLEQKQRIEAYQSNMQSEISILLSLNPQRMSYYSILSNLGSVSINSVWLESVNTNEDGSIIVTGGSLDYNSIQEYITALKKYYFPKTVLLSANNDNDNTAYVKFVLKIVSEH